MPCQYDTAHKEGNPDLLSKKWKHINTELCPCCKENPVGKPRSCGYMTEIEGDRTPTFCCDSCKSRCAENI